MVNPFKRRVDAEAGEAGVWLTDFPGWPGVWVKARAVDCDAAIERRRTLVEAIYGDPDHLIDDDALSAYVNARVFADTVVMEIRGFTDDMGKPIAWSPELASRMMFRQRTAQPQTPDSLDYDPAAKEILLLFQIAAARAGKLREGAEKKQPPSSSAGDGVSPSQPAILTPETETPAEEAEAD